MSDELHIFPCENKRPLTPNGLYDARPESQWTGNEGPQWGLPCGALNGVLVVDVDMKSGGLSSAEELDLSTAYIIPTPGGGFHAYYLYNTALHSHIRNGVGLLPGVDIRSQGGYVILYGEVSRSNLQDIPEWLLQLLSRPKPRLADLNAAADILEGGRNAYLAKAAGRLQKHGVLTVAQLHELNEAHCNPPLDPGEVEAVFNSIKRYIPDSTPEEDEVPAKPIVWANELLSGFLAHMRDTGKVQGLPTGEPELDKLLGGGKRLGELTVFCGVGKSGKNSYWHSLMVNWLNQGIPIGYASRELDPEREVLPNILSVATGLNLFKMPDISEGELVTCMKNWKLAFAPGYGSMTDDELFGWMDECRAHNISYFFIDHLHVSLDDSEDFKKAAARAKNIKLYAVKNTVHVDLIIQPKEVRKDRDGKDLPLGKGDLRGGSNLGQILDSLITWERQRDSEGCLTDISKLSLIDARSKLARPGKYFVQYDKETMKFEVVEPEEVRQPERVTIGGPVKGLGTRFERPASYAEKGSLFLDGDKTAVNMIKRINLRGKDE